MTRAHHKSEGLSIVANPATYENRYGKFLKVEIFYSSYMPMDAFVNSIVKISTCPFRMRQMDFSTWPETP